MFNFFSIFVSELKLKMAISEHTSDFELVEKLQKGDLDAFDQIFKKYGDRLFGFALSYLKSKEETEASKGKNPEF